MASGQVVLAATICRQRGQDAFQPEDRMQMEMTRCDVTSRERQQQPDLSSPQQVRNKHSILRSAVMKMHSSSDVKWDDRSTNDGDDASDSDDSSDGYSSDASERICFRVRSDKGDDDNIEGTKYISRKTSTISQSGQPSKFDLLRSSLKPTTRQTNYSSPCEYLATENLSSLALSNGRRKKSAGTNDKAKNKAGYLLPRSSLHAQSAQRNLVGTRLSDSALLIQSALVAPERSSTGNTLRDRGLLESALVATNSKQSGTLDLFAHCAGLRSKSSETH